jgi:hypothetical protein
MAAASKSACFDTLWLQSHGRAAKKQETVMSQLVICAGEAV